MDGTLPQHDTLPGPATTPAAPRIVVFDCETTGTDRANDQVIELCIQQGLEDGAPNRVWRIRPGVPIHPGAQAVHGIALADLEACPPFAAVADEIAAAFAGADIVVGYNLAFDIEMLQAEYARIARPAPDFASKKIVDAFRLWQQCEPRSLMHAHQRFVGAEFDAAHTASGDVAATSRVLAGMLRHFALEGHDWDSIAQKSDPLQGRGASWVGPSRHLRWEGDAIVFSPGAWSGLGALGPLSTGAVHELAAGQGRAVLERVLSSDLPPHVLEVCRAALELPTDRFLAWARDRFGQAAPTATPPWAPLSRRPQ